MLTISLAACTSDTGTVSTSDAKQPPAHENKGATTPDTPADEPVTDQALMPFDEPIGLNFASGAGGWATGVDINPDGSFTGTFHDTNMGETGEGHPNGTIYICEFSGSFTNVQRVDVFEYTMDLATIELKYQVGEEWVENDMLYIASEPYDFDDGGEFSLYLPGAKTAYLPEEYMEWIKMPLVWTDKPSQYGQVTPDELPFYGLYNVNGMMGFFGQGSTD
jgi:hypothetical protein